MSLKWVMLVLLCQACTHQEQQKGQGISEIREESHRRGLAAEIDFRPGTIELSQKAQDKLIALFDEARSRGRIEAVKAVSWGDRDYPSIHSRQTASFDEELVVRRNQSLLTFLDPLVKGKNIQLFNMAERKAALNMYFAHEYESTKRALENAGIPNTDTTVKVPGKASKSIVIFIMEE